MKNMFWKVTTICAAVTIAINERPWLAVAVRSCEFDRSVVASAACQASKTVALIELETQLGENKLSE